MSVTITKTLSKDKSKFWYKIELGKGVGQRIATGIFTYVTPSNQVQKDHNKETLIILEMKKSQMVLDSQSISSGYIPQHKYKTNFFDYYDEFVTLNKRFGNRHLENSLAALKKFHGKSILQPTEITENYAKRFRQYLLDKYNGETPMDYFARFKRVLKAATKDGYYRYSPAEDLKAKPNRNIVVKEIIEKEEYQKLLKTHCKNYEVQKAFIFSLYTGLRWADVKPLTWESIRDDVKTFRIQQKKTGVPLERPLHEVARKILGERKEGLVFHLPTQDGANKLLREWATDAGIKKHLSWHCARHSFSVLLQDAGTDTATVAGMLGHTSSKFVHKTYQRYRHGNAEKALKNLPDLK
jgi:integrase/recombinase XerD